MENSSSDSEQSDVSEGWRHFAPTDLPSDSSEIERSLQKRLPPREASNRWEPLLLKSCLPPHDGIAEAYWASFHLADDVHDEGSGECVAVFTSDREALRLEREPLSLHSENGKMKTTFLGADITLPSIVQRRLSGKHRVYLEEKLQKMFPRGGGSSLKVEVEQPTCVAARISAANDAGFIGKARITAESSNLSDLVVETHTALRNKKAAGELACKLMVIQLELLEALFNQPSSPFFRKPRWERHDLVAREIAEARSQASDAARCTPDSSDCASDAGQPDPFRGKADAFPTLDGSDRQRFSPDRRAPLTEFLPPTEPLRPKNPRDTTAEWESDAQCERPAKPSRESLERTISILQQRLKAAETRDRRVPEVRSEMRPSTEGRPSRPAERKTTDSGEPSAGMNERLAASLATMMTKKPAVILQRWREMNDVQKLHEVIQLMTKHANPAEACFFRKPATRASATISLLFVLVAAELRVSIGVVRLQEKR